MKRLVDWLEAFLHTKTGWVAIILFLIAKQWGAAFLSQQIVQYLSDNHWFGIP